MTRTINAIRNRDATGFDVRQRKAGCRSCLQCRRFKSPIRRLRWHGPYFDATQGKQLDIIKNSAEKIPLVITNLVAAFSTDGMKSTYSNDMGTGPSILDIPTRKQIELSKAIVPSENLVGPIAIDQTGSTIAVVVGSKGTICVIDGKTEKQKAVIKPVKEPPGGGAMAISRDGAMLAVTNDETSEIQLYDLTAKKAGALLVGHQPNTNAMLSLLGVAFSPDRKLLVSASYDLSIRVWDVTSGKQITKLDARSHGEH